MATLKKIPTSYLTPMRTLPQQEMADEYITNPQAGRLLVYGTRDTRLSDPPHDHGQSGGEIRKDVQVFAVSLGPEKTAAGPRLGIQIQRSALLLGLNPPRILGAAGVMLKAGQSQVSGLLFVAVDAIAQMTISVSLRPYTETNRDINQGLQATAQIIFTPLAAPSEAALSWSLTDLSSMGDSRYDREAELVVWQQYQPPTTVTSGHRLVGVYANVLVVDTRARDAERSELPRQDIAYADIKTGAILGQDIGAKMRATHNALMRGMLGRAPGLDNLGYSDQTRPYIQDIEAAHQHQGIDVPDGCGSFWSDGAVLRDTVAALSLHHINSVAGTSADYTGAFLHSSGVFDATSLLVELRCSIAAGLGALELRVAVFVGTAEQTTRFLVHCDVRGFDGVSICTGVSSGIHQQESALDSGGLFVCEIDPLDNNLFSPSRKRRLARAGLWTLAALRSQTPASGMRPTNQQISETIRINLTQPKIDSSNAPHATADYVLTVRLELQTPFGATAVDTASKLNWLLAVPARGF